jgi:hypothetical protein
MEGFRVGGSGSRVGIAKGRNNDMDEGGSQIDTPEWTEGEVKICLSTHKAGVRQPEVCHGSESGEGCAYMGFQNKTSQG